MYQAVGYDKKSNTMHVWDDELGHQKFNFKPYAYLPAVTGKYQSLDGTKLKDIRFMPSKNAGETTSVSTPAVIPILTLPP